MSKRFRRCGPSPRDGHEPAGQAVLTPGHGYPLNVIGDPAVAEPSRAVMLSLFSEMVRVARCEDLALEIRGRWIPVLGGKGGSPLETGFRGIASDISYRP